MDAFLWLLFGKDSTDRTAFEVKHISPNGNGSPKDVEVEGELMVDDQPVTLKLNISEYSVQHNPGYIVQSISGYSVQ